VKYSFVLLGINTNVKVFSNLASHEIALSDTVEYMKFKLICMSACLHLFPHLPELTTKPRISHNETTKMSPGRRSVLLKWEVMFTLSLATFCYVCAINLLLYRKKQTFSLYWGYTVQAKDIEYCTLASGLDAFAWWCFRC